MVIEEYDGDYVINCLECGITVLVVHAKNHVHTPLRTQACCEDEIDEV